MPTYFFFLVLRILKYFMYQFLYEVGILNENFNRLQSHLSVIIMFIFSMHILSLEKKNNKKNIKRYKKYFII